MALHDLGVVYLWRFAEGVMPAQRFLETYRHHPAGAAHDLYVVFKGFPERRAIDHGRALFEDTPINVIELDDAYYDIGSYIAAARLVTNHRLMFLNTFSEILSDDWLVHFDEALSLPGVALVGATGSWQANTASYEAALKAVFPKFKKPTKQACHSLVQDEVGNPENATWQRPNRTFKRYLFSPFNYLVDLYEYGRYPNPHIRTNAFLIERERFLSLRFPSFIHKEEAYRFESGRRSLTKQIIKQGHRPVVVDRIGAVYDISDWKSSSTFWTRDQKNLVVADNRTREYANASRIYRQLLENSAWVHPWHWAE